MPRITAYTYEADLHCVDCTQKASHRMKLDHQHPYARGESCKDDHGVEYDLVDQSGDLIHPVFSTDENPDYPLPQTCGDCLEEI